MDWINIIGGILGPIVAKCFEKTSSEDAQTVLREAFNPITGRMDPDLVRDCIPATRKAANKAYRLALRSDRKKFPRLSYDDLYAIAEAELIKAMRLHPEKLQAIFAAGAILGDDD